jgi:phage shock protein C
MANQIKKLYRSRKNRIIAGVCGGLGEYFGLDPALIRLFWVFITLAFGSGILLYLIAWILIPERPR